jgi:hypothetical protein
VWRFQPFQIDFLKKENKTAHFKMVNGKEILVSCTNRKVRMKLEDSEEKPQAFKDAEKQTTGGNKPE